MKTAIILGATSMLGSEIARQLSLSGVTVIRAGRQSDNDIVVDLASAVPPMFLQPVKAEVLIHCAAAFGNDSHEGLLENIRVNIAGCGHAVEIVRQAGVKKVVYAGSVFSYPEFAQDPMGIYGFSKAEAERILGWYAERSGGQFCSLRLSQLWDTEGRCCVHQPWFGRIIAYAASGLTLKLPPANGPRNFMHVSDAASLLIHAAYSNLQGVYAACHPDDVDIFELAKTAYEVFGNGGGVVIDESKSPFRQISFPHDATVFESLGFYPTISLPSGLLLIRDAMTGDHFGPLDVQ